MLQRVKIIIRGAVQGVGFRPFVYRLASELGIKGWIVNSSQGVFIEAEAGNAVLSEFILRLDNDKPKNSFIQSFEHTYLDYTGYTDFEIRQSNDEGSKTALVLPDISTCPMCIEEIFDPGNRRYLYPFTNCTNCGPRYSIIKDLPYDRRNTTMDEFEMCPECLAEYTDPLNRRFHAEPIACNVCGPQLSLLDKSGKLAAEKTNAMQETIRLIKEGKIIALKGIGGFQLICDAGNTEAVKLLRARKKRSEKPFAMMFPGIASVKEECIVSPEEEMLLLSVEAPIVLLNRKREKNSGISPEIAAGNPYYGIMLPYSPLHHILMKQFGSPVIATSGNISEEPICTDEFSAIEKLKGIADYYLVHNRKIRRHVDDSIARIAAGRQMILRRARGYAPLPVIIKGLNRSFLAFGPHLKNTIAVNNNENVFVSQHIGDLENIESINAFKKVTADLQNFYGIKPTEIICDLHPDYISTKFAKELKKDAVQVQHHYAHVLSCMAENEIEGKLLAVSWDGTGYGPDGAIWGGEFMIPRGKEFIRTAFLKPFKLPGGEAAIHDVWRIGFSLLYETYGDKVFGLTNIPFLKNFKKTLLLKKMLDKNINSPETTSMGRLFDGLSAVLGIREKANFEAQAAMELEFAAAEITSGDFFNYRVSLNSGKSYIIEWSVIIDEIVKSIETGESKQMIAVKFHNTLAEIILDIAKKTGFSRVLLTGGCFQNKLLLEKSILRLKQDGFNVYWHQRIPPNDGGISLGQVKFASYL